MVVFVRESRSGVGAGACCEGFALGSLLDIIGGTCCKVAICIETAREGQWEDKQLMLRKRRKHLVPFVFMDDLCRPPQLLSPTLSPLHQHPVLRPSPTALSSWNHPHIVPPSPNPCLGHRSSKPALSSKAGLSILTKPSLDQLSTLVTMPRSLIRQANWADIPDLVKAGVQPSWRMAPVRQEVGISHAILEYILDPRNTRFIVMIQLERPRFAMPGSKKNITAVALLEKPHDSKTWPVPTCSHTRAD